MMNSVIVRIVDLCARFRWSVIVAGTLLMLAAAAYDAARFSVNTDVEGLISQSLPWHQRQLELSRAFPQKGISAVVKAPTAENAEQATNALAQALAKNPKLFPLVGQPDSGDFFERNGLLFDSPADVKKSAAGLTQPVLCFPCSPAIPACAGSCRRSHLRRRVSRPASSRSSSSPGHFRSRSGP